MANIFLPHTRLNPVADKDIIDWLDNLEGYGAKGLAIKAALRRGFATKPRRIPSNTPAGGQAFDHNELLGDIRRVVDASLESSLARFEFSAKVREDEPSSKTDDILDNFGSLMMLD